MKHSTMGEDAAVRNKGDAAGSPACAVEDAAAGEEWGEAGGRPPLPKRGSRSAVGPSAEQAEPEAKKRRMKAVHGRVLASLAQRFQAGESPPKPIINDEHKQCLKGEEHPVETISNGWIVNGEGTVKRDLQQVAALMPKVEKAWEQWEKSNPHPTPFPDPVISNTRFVEFLQSSDFNFPSRYKERARFINDNSHKFGAVDSMEPGTLTRDHGYILCSLVIGRGNAQATKKYTSRKGKEKTKQGEE